MVGQEAVTFIQRYPQSRVGLKDPKRPIALPVPGPHRRGKGERMSKALSEAMFGANALIRVDMSEYGEAQRVQDDRLTARMGYDEAVSSAKNPPQSFNVILFDR